MLGDLSEAESAQLEDSSFSEPEQLEELRSVENDLIDEYGRGELSPGDRAKFERLFLANPERRQRVEFALALARVPYHQGSSPEAVSHAGTRTFRDFFSRPFRAPRSALIYATAALAVMVLTGAWWLFIGTNSLNEQMVRQERSGQEQVTPAIGPTGPSPELTTRTQPPEIAREGSPPPASNESLPPDNRKRAEATVATFLLLPGTSRSSSERTKLVIAPERQVMRLKLKLEEHDAVNYRSFAVELNRSDSKKAWASPTLSIQRNRTLILNIPVSSLPVATADYDLTLRGRSVNSAAFETIGYYYLTIVRE